MLELDPSTTYQCARDKHQFQDFINQGFNHQFIAELSRNLAELALNARLESLRNILLETQGET